MAKATKTTTTKTTTKTCSVCKAKVENFFTVKGKTVCMSCDSKGQAVQDIQQDLRKAAKATTTEEAKAFLANAIATSAKATKKQTAGATKAKNAILKQAKRKAAKKTTPTKPATKAPAKATKAPAKATKATKAPAKATKAPAKATKATKADKPVRDCYVLLASDRKANKVSEFVIVCRYKAGEEKRVEIKGGIADGLALSRQINADYADRRATEIHVVKGDETKVFETVNKKHTRRYLRRAIVWASLPTK